MPSYKTRHFNTAQELWNAIRPEEIGHHIGHHNYPIYRGQADSDWKLLPNASRGIKNKTVLEQAQYEIELILHFLDYCDKTGIQVPGDIPQTRLALKKALNSVNRADKFNWPHPKFYEILAFAQHFGVSTKLLDWSRRSFVAAYFSSSEAVKLITNCIQNGKKVDWNKNLAIWILETGIINAVNNKGLYSLEYNADEEHKLPLNIVNIPSGVNPHIAAQQGCFTIFRYIEDNSNSTEILDVFNPKFSSEKTIDTSSDMYFINYLHKWSLPYKEAHKLLYLCEQYNVNAASIYPTATGAGYAVRDRMNIEVIKKYLKQFQYYEPNIKYLIMNYKSLKLK
ncbi:FRG domain-containing protein [Acinetobacter sp. ME22]|uniref:FRG domain-containing protein n=1 Tax=Acinetobacter sp. ME22 TaxID=2904802 RepID=UPI001EDA36DB|nr:FRG domain-containing protein [Acinetobacter sp. ME22]MCG2572253.1 FRG domain-containing protein [Acinetobacter sp. ME22]